MMFSFGELKSDEVDVEVVAMAATSLGESYEQLQTRLASHNVTTSSTCNHANLIEEHAKLQDEISLSTLKPINNLNIW